jgi:hypothetical protein
MAQALVPRPVWPLACIAILLSCPRVWPRSVAIAMRPHASDWYNEALGQAWALACKRTVTCMSQHGPMRLALYN